MLKHLTGSSLRAAALAVMLAVPQAAGAVTTSGTGPTIVAVESGETNSTLLGWIEQGFATHVFDTLLSASIAGYGYPEPSGGGYGVWLDGYVFNGALDPPLPNAALLGQSAIIFFNVISKTGLDYVLGLGEIRLVYDLGNGTTLATYRYGDPATTASLSVPAPGPIAGAGIPALLGLMGYGLWRRTRASA